MTLEPGVRVRDCKRKKKKKKKKNRHTRSQETGHTFANEPALWIFFFFFLHKDRHHEASTVKQKMFAWERNSCAPRNLEIRRESYTHSRQRYQDSASVAEIEGDTITDAFLRRCAAFDPSCVFIATLLCRSCRSDRRINAAFMKIGHRLSDVHPRTFGG